MATAGEHFALDWIKGDLLETLNEARVALDDFAELGGDETRLRTCLTGLHQVHGTLVMLEFEGVTLLADYLEQLAQAMHDGRITDMSGAGQVLMQGILELPGYLDDLQAGGADSTNPFVPLVNEARSLMGMSPLAQTGSAALAQGASEEVVRRFDAIDGAGKVARMRSAYQNVLLHILKGQERTSAVATLSKIALGLAKVCEGAPLEQQWRAFGEFVDSLGREEGALETEAVKLLRRIDVEIKELARHGSEILKQPVNVDLIQQLLDAATARDHSSDTLMDLQEAVQSSGGAATMTISGRQALSSAAQVLQEDLAVVKDQLDLMMRAPSLDVEQLRQLSTPLKQIGSTLSLLGFESSRQIVIDQVEAIDRIAVLEDNDPLAASGIVSALAQLEENLNSVIDGGAGTEAEQITTDAQRQLVIESRNGLEEIKQNVVDFVTAHWSVGHLSDVPSRLNEIRGALQVIPLTRVIDILTSVQSYVEGMLMKGHQPGWEELDRFADVLSAVDYYLERLGEDVNSGSEEILSVAQRSLAELQTMADRAGVGTEDQLDAEIELPAEPMAVADADREVDDALQGLLDDVPEEDAVQPSPPAMTAEADDDFDLSSDVFDDILDAEESPSAHSATPDTPVAPELTAEMPEETADADSPALSLEPLEDELTLPEEALPDEAMPDEAMSAEPMSEELVPDEPMSAEPMPAEPMPAEPMAQEAASPVDTGSPLAPAAEVEAPDPEIVEIFVEEVGEVMETLGEYVPQWAETLAVDDALTEVRRAFHTLKGSGRIVQAVVIGELAWCIENMLNRVMDGTVVANPSFVDVVNEACALIPGLRDEFAVGRSGDLDAVGVVVERADILASGGEVPELRPTAEAPAPVSDMIEWEPQTTAAPSDALDLEEPIESAAAPEIEAAADDFIDQVPVSEEAPALAFDTELPDLDDLAAMIGDDGDDDRASLMDSETDAETYAETDAAADDPQPADLALFVEEVEEALPLLAQASAAQPWSLSDTIARIYHTLVGSAALAQAEAIKLVVEPADQVSEFFRSQPPSAEIQAFFEQAEGHLRDFVQAYRDGRIWDEPLEFVALADDLIAGRDDSARPIQQLLDAPVTEAVFKAEADLNALLEGDAERADEVVRVLQEMVEFARTANEMYMTPVADLAGALQARLRDLPRDGFGEPSNDAAAGVLRSGYEQLIDQLNELAGGSAPVSDPVLLEQIAAVQFAAPEPEVAAQPELSMAPGLEAEPEAEPEVETPAVMADTSDNEPAAADQIDLADIDDDLIQVFFEEAEEIGEDLENSVLSWDRERDNRLHLENMLRSLHTLKGGARLCGLAHLGDQVHDFESMLIDVQNDSVPLDDALFAQVQQRYDEITEYVGRVQAQYSGAPQQDVAPAQAQETEPADASSQVEFEVPASPAAVVQTLHRSAAEQSDAEQSLEPAPVSASQPRESAAAAAPTVERQPQEMVRVSSALLEQLVNLAGESSILRARIEQGMSDFAGALDEMETTIERLREQLRRLEIETETQVLYRHERSDGPSYDQFDPLEMDRYNQIQQLSRGLSESASDMLDLKETLLFKSRESETLLLQQARINTELQEGLMRTRMVPFSRLLPRLRRIVRQVSSELGKEVELHVQNAEGEMDRNLLERMLPPLEHMLRNAVDHGIEAPQMRRTYGKAAAGRIDLRLTREGGDVVIEIIDDGAGIDVETVRAKAIERGLLSEDAPLSDEEVLQFVLAAGFSTAESVTQISGRGVGLDVVNSEVKQLGGSVSIVSTPGKGSRFIVRVPFTVSVNRALMVSVGEDQYAIPLNTIEGIVLLSPEQLQALYNGASKSFEYAGVPYRVRYLGQYLGREYQPDAMLQSSVPVVLVRSGDHAVAIHVDQVQGSREIVVKSLGPQFAGVGGISGATIFGDGSVVVILDLLALIRAQQSRSAMINKAARVERRGPTRVMVVDDSVTVRKVTSRLLERQGMDVLVAKDGIEAVALLQEQRPDIMLLDIEMPRMDGFEVARQVRHDDRLTSLPIVMISSRTGEKHKEHASELGVNKFLGKPFQENELLATIDELVTGR